MLQQKTQRPVQSEITPPTREALELWIKRGGLKSEDFLFPSRVGKSPHIGTRQYARILDHWVEEIGLDPAAYGTHSMRRIRLATEQARSPRHWLANPFAQLSNDAVVMLSLSAVGDARRLGRAAPHAGSLDQVRAP